MKEGLSDSIIKDTHVWESIPLITYARGFEQPVFTVQGWVCSACKMVVQLKNMHGSDRDRTCRGELPNSAEAAKVE